MVLALTIALAVALAFVGWLTFKHRGRLADLEAIDRQARADQTASLAEARSARRDVGERLDALLEREREVSEREDAIERLAEQTARYRTAVFRMGKDVIRDCARTEAETRRDAQQALEEAGRRLADSRQLQAKTAAFFNDDGLKRYLRRQEAS